MSSPSSLISQPVINGLWPAAQDAVVHARKVHNVPEPLVDVVYHYTGMSTLANLAQPAAVTGVEPWSRLWASSLAFMNDSQEFRHGHELMQEAWEAEILSCTDAALKRVLEGARDAVASADLHERALDVYVICFCASGDLLSQWRGYAEFGKGVSMGFDRKVLSESIGGFGFWVLYDLDAQREVARSVVEEIAERLSNLVHSGNVDSVVVEVQDWIPVFMTLIYSVLKHEAFSEEQEFRIVYNQRLDLPNLERKFRSRGGALVPYVEFRPQNNAQLPILDLVVGPGAAWPANLASIRRLLEGSKQPRPHGKVVTVTPSQVPLI